MELNTCIKQYISFMCNFQMYSFICQIDLRFQTPNDKICVSSVTKEHYRNNDEKENNVLGAGIICVYMQHEHQMSSSIMYKNNSCNTNVSQSY